jgi:hypothetical protein
VDIVIYHDQPRITHSNPHGPIGTELVFDLSYSEFLSFGREFFVNLENKRGFDLE